MVKVELQQVIAHPAGHDVAARIHVNYDRVPGVFQRHRPRDVVELNRLRAPCSGERRE